MLHVTCQVSHVKCHMSRVTCHMWRFFFFFFWQSGGASRWRVCYQRGLPRLVIYICSVTPSFQAKYNYYSVDDWNLKRTLIWFTSTIYIYIYSSSLFLYKTYWICMINVPFSTEGLPMSIGFKKKRKNCELWFIWRTASKLGPGKFRWLKKILNSI